MTEPYYQKDGVTIYNGDCLQILRELPAASVDAVITDPPYCSGGSLESQKNTKGQGMLTVKHGAEWFAGDNMSTPGLVFLVRACLVQARRFLKPNRSAMVFTDWRMVPNIAPAIESCGMRYRNMIVWDKGNPGMGVGFKPTHEILLEFTNGVTEYQSLKGSNVINSKRVHISKRKHPCEKPGDLLGKVLSVTVPEDGVVVDPFMGGGSVLGSCVRFGCQYIGIEIDERYCEAAASRLDQGVLF